MKTENAWKKYTDKKEVFDFCGAYKDFMSCCKTERECVSQMIKMAEKRLQKSGRDNRSGNRAEAGR